MVSFAEPAEMAEDAVEVHERFGVQTFKVKVGARPTLDVAAVRARSATRCPTPTCTSTPTAAGAMTTRCGPATR